MPSQASRLTPLARALRYLLLGASLSLGSLARAEEAPTRHYQIAPTSLENALNQFGRQAGVLVSFGSQVTGDLQSHGLKGDYSPAAGLANSSRAVTTAPVTPPRSSAFSARAAANPS